MIYPHQPTKDPIKIAVLQDGIKTCQQNVQDVFQKAVEIIKKDSNVMFSNVEMPHHELAGKAASVVLFNGGFDSMVEGCGYGMGISGIMYNFTFYS